MRPSTKSTRLRFSTTASPNSSAVGSPPPPHPDTARPSTSSSMRRAREGVMSRGAGSDHGAARRKRPAGPDDAENRLLLLENAPRRVQIGPSLEAREGSALGLRRHGELRPEPEGSEREGCGDPDLEAHGGHRATPANDDRTLHHRVRRIANPLRDVTHVRGIGRTPSATLEVGRQHAVLELRELTVELE